MLFQQDVLKSIAQFNIESLLAEDNLAIVRSIVKSKSNKPLKFKDGTMKCDLMTASAITQVYDKVNPANKKKLEKMMNGTKRDFLKLQSAAFQSNEIGGCHCLVILGHLRKRMLINLNL